MPIHSIAQIDGWVRYVALSEQDYRRVRRDPALIDAVTPLGVLDALRLTDPALDWEDGAKFRLSWPHGRPDQAAVRTALRHAATGEG